MVNRESIITKSNRRCNWGASGIGEACVRLFANYGCKVIITDIDSARASVMTKEINCQTIEIDVGDEASIKVAIIWVEKI